MSETALYYTLSTVSQTLAGALGMLAAFLALRVSALDTAIRSDLQQLEVQTQSVNPAVRPADGRTSTAWKGWRAWWGQYGGDPSHAWKGQLIDRGERAEAVKAALLRQAKWAFAGSAAVMGSCFVGLAAAPWLSCVWLRAWAAAFVVIVGGMACLVWYGRIVREALD